MYTYLKSTALAFVLAGFAAFSALAAGLTVPDTIDSGDTVAVTIANPGQGDKIELWGPVTQRGVGQLILSEAFDGASIDITFELPAGSYQLRHVSASGARLATSAIDVSAEPVTLGTDGAVDPSARIAVKWRGPAGPGDTLRIVATGDTVGLSEAAADGAPGTLNRTMIKAPGTLGRYELQYVTGSGVVLRTLQVDVSAGRNWLRSPIGVSTGQTFEVSWEGNMLDDHVFRMATEEGAALAEAPLTEIDGSIARVEFRAPSAPGRYLMQLVDNVSGEVVTSLPLDVDS